MIDKKVGTMDINKLGGLLKYLPITFIITLLAALSMAGLPPMLGFLGKELIYEAKIQSPGIANMVLVLGVASNVLMIAVSLFFVYKIFLGKPHQYVKSPNEKGPGFWLGPMVLVVLSLFFGLFPSILGSTLVESAVSAVREEDIAVKLKLWHGFNDVFFLSLFTVLLGFSLFFLLIKRDRLLARWRALNRSIFKIKLTELFDKTIEGFVNFTTQKSRAIQHGYHRYYILTIILFTSVLIWYQVFVTGGFKLNASFSFNPFYISGLIVIIISAATFSIFAKTRITTIIALGVIGYGISLIYLYYGAIDLSITQIIVETIIIAMFVMVLQKLPRFAKLSSSITKVRDIVVALIFGSVMTLIALRAIDIDFLDPISKYYIDNSMIKAFGKNVVNVILVDFRALDTMGEVIVLSIAAFGVSLLLQSKTGKT
jgi:multicomponent Na+:H+ antiporter subunit A